MDNELEAAAMPQEPITSLPSAQRKAAAIAYAEAVAAGLQPSDEVRASYEKYLKSQRKKLYSELLEHSELAECMMDCAAIPTSEVWDLVAELTGKPEAAELLESLKAYRRGEDRKKKDAKAQRAVEQAQTKAAKLEAIKKLEAERAAELLREMLKDAEPEVLDNYPADGIDKSISAAVTEGVRLADGSGESSPHALALLIHLMGIPRKGVNTCRLGETSDLDSKMLSRKKVAFITDPMDADALSDSLEALYFDKGLALALAPLCAFGNDSAVERVVAEMPRWDDWYSGGMNGRKDINIAMAALLENDTRAVVAFFDKHKLLWKYAEHNRKSEDALRDSLLSDFGFGKDGTLLLDLGGKSLEASIGDDLKIALFDVDAQKAVKSVPKRGSDPERYEQVKAQLSKMRKDIRKVVSQRRKLLLDDFLSGRERDAAGWKKAYLDNPVLRSVARLVVWQQGSSTFTVRDGGLVGPGGESYKLARTKVSVAHPMEMAAGDVSAWREYFASTGLKQPFRQVWERAIDFEGVAEDRYVGNLIPYYRFRGRDEHGIHIEDYDFHNEIEIEFDDCYADVERIDWGRHWIDSNHRFEIKEFIARRTRMANHIVDYLDRICVYPRVASNDMTFMEFVEESEPMLADIIDYISVAAENGATELEAALVEYRHARFEEYDDIDSLLLL